MKIKADIEKEIWGYLDGALTTEEREAFELRLRKDEELRSAFAELKHFDQSLHSEIVHKAPEGLRSVVLETIRSEESSINQSVKVLIGVMVFIGMASALGAFVAFDKLTLDQSLSNSLLESMGWLTSPIIMSLIGVILLALIVEVYLLRPSTPK